MRHWLYITIAALCALAPLAPLTATAQAKTNIFACEPEWAALATEIGGDKVKTVSATHAKQNPHYIRARPSLIAKARRAELIICSGAGLETGWLPLLLQKAKPQTQTGALGHLMAAEHVPVLEKPTTINRAQGDIHPEGNPHIHLNPHNILLVAQELTTRLATIDPANATHYQTRHKNFSTRWQRAITEWQNQAAPLHGKSVITHHRNFSYLLDWLKMKDAASLEPKPGLPPTASHLQSLLQKFKTPASTPAPAPAPAPALIIRTPYDPDEAALWLAEKTNTPALILPYTVGGDPQSQDLFALFNRTLALLLTATEK